MNHNGRMGRRAEVCGEWHSRIKEQHVQRCSGAMKQLDVFKSLN